MAGMLEQLGLEPGHNVLEIGAGTGYNAALMAHIVGETGKVTTVDIDEDTVAGAREHLGKAGFDRIEVICGDGGNGYAEHAPYDRIILTVGAAEIAPAWPAQLKTDGRMVVPLALVQGMPGGGQRIVGFEHSSGCLVSTSIKMGGFMPLRGAYPGLRFSEGHRVQLSLEPGPQLHFWSDDPREVDPEAIYQLLTGHSQDLPTGIQITSHELWTRYALWSSLVGHDQDYRGFACGLSAEGDLADQGPVPYLIGLAGKFCSTGGLFKDGSLAVYLRPAGQTPPRDWPKDEPPFELWVRSYGGADALAAYLIEHMRRWDAAGRPIDETKWRIRAYPREAEYTASANEIIIEREVTRLVIDW
jgi:protein-L-isoaspartate(D-aspartate) O-methyltransferase